MYYLKLHNIISDTYGKNFSIVGYEKDGINVMELSDANFYEGKTFPITFAELKEKIESKKFNIKFGVSSASIPYETDRDKVLLQTEINGMVKSHEKHELSETIEKVQADTASLQEEVKKVKEETEQVRQSSADTIAGMEAMAGGEIGRASCRERV